jgi:phosphoglycerate dehydrogenase-like enzyme
LNIQLTTLHELLPEVQVLTLHAPLTDETRHLISERELKLMQPGAVIVNTARGELLDTSALVAALDEGRLASAGLDVFEQEPLPPDHALMGRPNVLLSGHAATFTRGAVQRTVTALIASLLDLERGVTPQGCINPEALKRWVEPSGIM